MTDEAAFTAFHGSTHLLTAPLRPLLSELHARQATLDPASPLLVFEDATGRERDFNLRGPLETVLEREAPLPPKAGPGRPRLGVTSREVSLLPRHWDWLETQRGGASATLRRLIDAARQAEPDRDRAVQARAATDRFLRVMVGDLPGYEEATRALYAGQRAAFEAQAASWPPDVQAHALRLAAGAFGGAGF